MGNTPESTLPPKIPPLALKLSPASVLVCVWALRSHSPCAEALASCVLCWPCWGNHSCTEFYDGHSQIKSGRQHFPGLLFFLTFAVFSPPFPPCSPSLGGTGFIKMPQGGLRTESLALGPSPSLSVTPAECKKGFLTKVGNSPRVLV